MILHSQFNLAIRFRKQGHFAVYDKDYRNVWTPRKMPPMRSAEYQATILLKFLIIMQMFSTINKSKSLPGFQVVMSLDSINDWLIQTLLRGENYSKQSGEIQANQN